MKLNTLNTKFAVCALVLSIAGAAFAAPQNTNSKKSGTTSSASSNILPIMDVSPSFYVIGVPMGPDPTEPTAVAESRPGYSIVPATPTLNGITPLAGSTEPGSLEAAIQIEPEYAVFNRLITYSGLNVDLSKVSQYTLLAPTNSAFAKLPQDQLESWLLPENHEKLRDMLKAHIIVGSLTTTQIGGETTIKTLAGNWFPVANNGGTISIGSAKVVKADVTCANGIIDTVDTVLMPQ